VASGGDAGAGASALGGEVVRAVRVARGDVVWTPNLSAPAFRDASGLALAQGGEVVHAERAARGGGVWAAGLLAPTLGAASLPGGALGGAVGGQMDHAPAPAGLGGFAARHAQPRVRAFAAAHAPGGEVVRAVRVARGDVVWAPGLPAPTLGAAGLLGGADAGTLALAAIRLAAVAAGGAAVELCQPLDLAALAASLGRRGRCDGGRHSCTP
jgi:hypothetical protein